MTNDQEYNRCFFATLKNLPSYYNRVMNAKDNEERRKVLEEFYNEVMEKISSKLGGYKETSIYENILTEIHSSKATISLEPSKDVTMLVYWDSIPFFDGIPHTTEIIKKRAINAL